MAIDSHKFSLSASLTVGVAYLICSVFCYLWPQFSLDSMAPMVHQTNLDKFMPLMVITPRMVVLGLVQYVAYTYAFVYLWAWLYNGLLER